MHFLVVENDSETGAVIRAALEAGAAGTSCYLTRNTSEAQAYLTGAGMYANRSLYPLPSAIITNLWLGYESSRAFLSWVRQQPAFDNIQLIVLISSAHHLSSFDVLDFANSTLLLKHQEPEEFSRTVQELTLTNV
jgi:DNA-binding response OmpR family regulator